MICASVLSSALALRVEPEDAAFFLVVLALFAALLIYNHRKHRTDHSSQKPAPEVPPSAVKQQSDPVPESQPPVQETLALLLPKSIPIRVESYWGGTHTVGKRYRVGTDYEFPAGAFIQYKVQNVDDGRAAFAASYHPFLRQFTDRPEQSAREVLAFFSYRPYRFDLTRDQLSVNFDSGYYNTGYTETPTYIEYRESYQESYHDGGGSGSLYWCLYPAGEVHLAAAKVLRQDPSARFRIPACKTIRMKDGHVYLENPWGLTGVFEYYCSRSERDDYQSPEEHSELGVCRPR